GPVTTGFQLGFNQATLAVVNHWFRRRRGLAMAIVQTGQSIGGGVLVPLVALAVLTRGGRTPAALSGLGVLLLGPLVLLVGLLPCGAGSRGVVRGGEGRAPPGPSVYTRGPVHSPGDTHEFTAGEALRTPTFWLLAAFHSLRNVPYSGVTVHLVPLLVWKGMDE